MDVDLGPWRQADSLNTYGTAEKIVTCDLNVEKKSARFVPKLLDASEMEEGVRCRQHRELEDSGSFQDIVAIGLLLLLKNSLEV